MASQVSPGIVIKERDLSNAVITGAQQITAAFASTFKKGPIGQVVNISSQKQLIDVFGKPSDANAEDWYVASEFLSYGGRLAVVRAATTLLNATTGSAGVLVKNDSFWQAGTGSSEVFVARTAGTWANSLKIVVVDRGADQIITLAEVPDTVPSAGSNITFNVNGNSKAAEVLSWDNANKKLAVILNDPSVLITTADTLEDGATDVAITAVADWYSNTEIGSTGLKLSAIGPRPGTSNFASTRGVKYDEVHVAVIDTTGDISGAANTIVERFNYLSKISDGKNTEGANIYYKDVINQQSTYIYNGTHPTATINPSTAGAGEAWGQASTALASGDLFALCGNFSDDLAYGTDDYAYDSAEIGDAYDLFLDTEETTVDFVLMGGSMALESDTKAKAAKVVSIASARKDCVAFVSPHKGNQVGVSGALSTSQQKVNTINFFNGLASTSYAVFDSGYKYFYDRFNDKYRYIPCNGDVAGLCVATSSILDDWYSPAGLNRGSLRNAVRLAYNPNKADRDELYQARINPIVSFPGSGVTLFGDKTALASPSAFDRINVRRLFLNVQRRVEGLAKQVLFEQNDETTRSSFASAVNSYMSEVQARRGVTDFLVVCDESNNTPDVIDRNEFVAEIFIKPTRSINYITVTLTATKTGVSFAEVVGR
ncbi:MAG TPA: phage tail sheath subtilisin-like domain-containing protein [Prochlorococcaceae cyanobacterium AMR_MDS_5431]|nr:phage tail sheath subtilisin-like domain-containing protein [Prochlorococcaceae cyanobacterium AMR_MDS_5431]